MAATASTDELSGRAQARTDRRAELRRTGMGDLIRAGQSRRVGLTA
eukprot:SAG22_NODE_20049_length_269_cov_0.605882_1_plen_45_part_10